MTTLMQDLKYGIRMLLKSPGFTAVVVLSLGLGIGANTAIFTLIDAVMLKTLPVEKPEQLALFFDGSDEGTRISRGGMGTGERWRYYSCPLYEYLRDHNQFFQGICAFRLGEDRLSVSVEGARASSAQSAQKAIGHLVSGNYFSVLGVNVILGRTLSPEDDRPGARPAAVISYGYWKSEFGGDESVVGKVADLNGTPFTIVGVTPPEFFGERLRKAPDFWLPLATQPQVMLHDSYLNDSGVYWLDLMGRLKPGGTRQQAQAAATVQLRQYFSDLFGSHLSEDDRKEIAKSYVELGPGGPGISGLRLNYSQPLRILMAFVALVLLIACANVANLLLARAAARQKEISMRLALGAGRGRLIRQLLTESLIMATLGGVLGALLAAWGVEILVTKFAGRTSPLNVHPDLRVLVFTLLVCALAAILFGLAPALRSTRVDLAPALKANTAAAGTLGRRWSLGKALVSLQAALSLLMLFGAGLFVRTLQNLEAEDLGFNQQHVLLVSIDPRLAGYQPAQLAPFYQQLLDRVNALPGVRSASVAAYSPLSGSSRSTDITVQGYTPPPGADTDVNVNVVGWKYFATAGMPMLLGREFGPQDTPTSPKVAVVNATVAHDFFGKGNPIGRRFGFGGGDAKHSGDIEIVGVVADAKYRDVREKPQRMVFTPVLQAQGDEAYVSEVDIRTLGDPRAIASEVRGVINEINSSLSVTNVITLSEQVHDWFDEERTISELSSFFGLLALTLASVGLYGVMAYAVARRTSEIGIRMALGARSADVRWMVLREALLLVLAGVTIGVPAALTASRLVASMLFGLTPWDPLTISAATLVLVAVAVLAGYVPARRASRVSPMVALRYE
jgi:predicted permease